MSPRKRTPEAAEQLRDTLIEHAQRIITRDGAKALTMRTLAAEAGCALGLPYKVFADRGELVAAIVQAEFARLAAAGEKLITRAGAATVTDNLVWYAELLLDSPAVALAGEVMADRALAEAVAASAHQTGAGPVSFEAALSGYLAAEQHAGRVEGDVDTAAFGFLIAGAVHNLVMSGPAYLRPTRTKLRQHLAAVADQLQPR